jgi:hypothetical protein
MIWPLVFILLLGVITYLAVRIFDKDDDDDYRVDGWEEPVDFSPPPPEGKDPWPIEKLDARFRKFEGGAAFGDPTL